MKLKELVKQPGVYLDVEDLERLGEFNAYIDDQHRVIICLGKRHSEQFLHKYLFPEADYVDHENRNCTDNRKNNLRPCTLSQNQGNRKLSINNSTGYNGVDFHKASKKFRARIAKRYLGLANTSHEAALIYNAFAVEYFGEFATFNLIGVKS